MVFFSLAASSGLNGSPVSSKAEKASAWATELAASGDLIAQLDAQIAESWVRSERGQLD